jgi:hypothetical protein
MGVEQRDDSQIIAQMSRLLEERNCANTALAQRLETIKQNQLAIVS